MLRIITCDEDLFYNQSAACTCEKSAISETKGETSGQKVQQVDGEIAGVHTHTSAVTKNVFDFDIYLQT